MKYLILNGSGHKGNTWQLVTHAMNVLKKLDDNYDAKEIHLSSMNIPFCCGCSNCFRLGYETCPHYSKIKVIVEEMEQADGIIIASTTYNMSQTALLKNVFDHFCFFIHRPHFFKSKALVITTTGGVGGKKAAKEIASTLYAIGFNQCDLFSKATYSWNDYKPTKETIGQLTKKVNQFYKNINSGKLVSPSWGILIPYNLFRGMSLTYTKEKAFPTKDGEHWSDPNRRNGVYDSSVPIPFYKKPFGQLFYLLGKFMGKQKKMVVTYKK